jgi:hypothetical protein
MVPYNYNGGALYVQYSNPRCCRCILIQLADESYSEGIGGVSIGG